MKFYQEEDIKGFDLVQFEYIKTEQDQHIFKIILNRPEKRNAFTPAMAEEITYALAYAHYSSDIRCVILSAEGSVFCAGADLQAFHDPGASMRNNSIPVAREEVKLGDAFAQLLKPSIAIVHGPVLAGGFLMICGCTFVYSVPEATYSLPEVKRGIWPMQVMASLLPIVPARKIMEMAITGRVYSAPEALDLGLVTHIYPSEHLTSEAEKLAAVICSNAPYAIRLGMDAFQKMQLLPQNEQQTFLKGQLSLLLKSDDAHEGTQAFKEKRNPVWKGK